ncbi:MAG TPA: hypothetical protein VFJ69_15325 [Actinomycetota bacterium]|nr:hypothetical protein [Actinomycetota bacterium]
MVALPADEELPDACFVDDCAVVLGGRALVAGRSEPTSQAGIHQLTAFAEAALGFEVRQVDLSEFAKADGGATCLSLLV